MKPRLFVGAFLRSFIMTEIFNAIEALLQTNPQAITAIDGNCASGKTTLSRTLAERFNAQVIHTDDFFLPLEMRTAERLSTPGGNIHYERFIEEVVGGIKSGKPFEYGVFNCSQGKITHKKQINIGTPIIIEGAYSMHPAIPDIYDLHIFLEISSETQLQRILMRNGAEALESFKSKWIPLENEYFERHGIREKCDLIISTD